MAVLDFDPERDLPPHGATVKDEAGTVVYSDYQSAWVVLDGSHKGWVARPFTDEGIAMARAWAAQRSANDKQEVKSHD